MALLGDKQMQIKFYWHRHWRVWVITKHDADGNQIDEAEYAPNKAARDLILSQIAV